MSKTISYSLQTLPPEVQAIIFQEQNADINHAIAVAHGLTVQQLNQALQILVSVIVKELPVGKFLSALAVLDLPKDDLAKLALDFAYLRLWPLQGWLLGVDKLITSLGGTVPKNK